MNEFTTRSLVPESDSLGEFCSVTFSAHDRDPLFTKQFKATLNAGGVPALMLPSRVSSVVRLTAFRF